MKIHVLSVGLSRASIVLTISYSICQNGGCPDPEQDSRYEKSDILLSAYGGIDSQLVDIVRHVALRNGRQQDHSR